VFLALHSTSIYRKTCVSKKTKKPLAAKTKKNPEVSEEVAKSIMGHASRKMLERYSHQRIEAKRAALDALPKSSATKLLQLAQKKSSDEG
jgi:hypothetical protein